MRQSSARLFGKVLRWVLPLVISGLAIWFVLRDVELSQFAANLSNIGLGTYLLASLCFFGGLFLRVFCWYILLGRNVSFMDTFFTMNAGYLLNNVFPFRLGEVGRALLLDDPEGPSGLEVLSSILVERILDVFLAAVFVLTTLPRILGAAYDQGVITLALILALIGLVLLFLMGRYRELIGRWLHGWGEKSPFVRNWAAPKVGQVLQGLAIFDRPAYFLLAFSALTASWFFAFLENYVVFGSLYPSPPFWWLVFVLSAGAFGAALPSAPAALGLFEGVMVAAFALVGVGQAVALTHAIVIHALQFIFTNVLGLIGLRLRGQAVVDLYRRATRKAPSVSTPD